MLRFARPGKGGQKLSAPRCWVGVDTRRSIRLQRFGNSPRGPGRNRRWLGQGAETTAPSLVVASLQEAHPKIQFNLEMITRDPLKIPCLTRKYWATMATVPARHLAAALAMVRHNPPNKPLPRTGGLDLDQQLALEDGNVRAS